MAVGMAVGMGGGCVGAWGWGLRVEWGRVVVVVGWGLRALFSEAEGADSVLHSPARGGWLGGFDAERLERKFFRSASGIGAGHSLKGADSACPWRVGRLRWA